MFATPLHLCDDRAESCAEHATSFIAAQRLHHES